MGDRERRGRRGVGRVELVRRFVFGAGAEFVCTPNPHERPVFRLPPGR